jgi:delta24(24(1))-sterol reductase
MSIDSLHPPPQVNSNGVPLFKQKVTKRDVQVDNEVKYEFGGPVGVCAMMIGFPCLMYYFWICLEYHQGQLIYPPAQIEQWKPWFVNEIWNMIKQGAYPTRWATQVYMGYVLFSFVLAHVMPGPVIEGLPVPSLNGQKVSWCHKIIKQYLNNLEQIKYLCNGLSSWYLTLVLSITLHVTGIFRLTSIVDHFGEIMTVAIVWGFVLSTIVYISGIALGKTHRMSGNLFYDYFMGSFLNPRIGHVDLKMWAEIRVPWPILFYLSVSCLLKQYETYGQVTAPAVFMVLAHFLYVNACQKGEECIPISWDIIYEKDGKLPSLLYSCY